MNARQKAKKLKKELEELKKEDKTKGLMWLKIDGIAIKEEDPELWCNGTILRRKIPVTYVIKIGTMKLECTPYEPCDQLIVIDSSKLDGVYNELVVHKESDAE